MGMVIAAESNNGQIGHCSMRKNQMAVGNKNNNYPKKTKPVRGFSNNLEGSVK
jgi:hypothetical protein